MRNKKPLLLLALSMLLIAGCDSSLIPSSSQSTSTSTSSSQTSEVTPWTVTFDLNRQGAPELDSINVATNALISAPTFTYAPENDTFLGWYQDRAAFVAWNFATHRITADRTLYAGWQSIIDARTDDDNGEDPSDDYDYYDSDFFPVTHIVTFNSNYTDGPIVTRNVPEGSVAFAPKLARFGHQLIGWYDAPTAGASFDFATPITAPITLYAYWNALTSYTITLDLNYSGAPAPTTVTGYEGLKLSRPANPTRENYDFLGWHKDALTTTLWDFGTDLVTSNITLYAKWSRLPLPGVYVLVSDSWAEDNATFVLWHGAETVNRNGVATGVPNEYYFDNAATTYLALKRYVGATMVTQVHSIAANGGWSTTWNQIIVLDTTPKTGPEKNATTGSYVTLVMRDNSVDENLTTHNVTFNYNYSGAPSPVIKTVLEGRKVTPPTAPTRSGYFFQGWYTEAEAGTLFDFNDPIMESKTLYARWQQESEAESVIVTFNYNYASSPAPVEASAYVGQLLTAPTTITRQGYTLDGWYKESTLTNQWNFATDIVFEAMTLYAKWSQQTATRTDGVYVRVNDNWAANSATFELYYTSIPAGGVQTKVGVATGVTNEYFFNQVLGNGPVILRRKVSGSQVAQIYDIGVWSATNPDYRSFNINWNRIVLNDSLAGNVSNQQANSSVITLEMRPSNLPPYNAMIRPMAFIPRKEML
ncbi:MAG TPA: InlB B-repeat-containing protein [Bacilli bacterium]|nr:InlB B-repeat-containing protein [Bacilli bacterium]